MDLVEPLRLPLRAAASATLAVGIALTFSLGSPVYALVSAVVVTDLDPAQTRKQALPRVVGTFLGGAFGCVATLLLQPGAWAVGVAVLLPMFLCQLLKQSAAAKLAGYVSGIIVLGFSTHPWIHARDRLIETLVGIAAATAISAIPVWHRAKTNPG